MRERSPAELGLQVRAHAQPFYNYSVFAFREWCKKCAMGAFWGSQGYIDGFFLDATPKVADGQNGGPGPADMKLWGETVDELKRPLGPSAIVIDNGFFLAGKYPHNKQLAGADAWIHTGASYAEPLASIGDGTKDPEQDILHLTWLANASAADAKLELFGHGNIAPNASTTGALDPVFEFSLAKYMLVTASMERGWFLSNSGYSIDGGLLAQPTSVYKVGLGCVEPAAALVREGKTTMLTRRHEHGTVAVDVKEGTASIRCGSEIQRPPLKVDDGYAALVEYIGMWPRQSVRHNPAATRRRCAARHHCSITSKECWWQREVQAEPAEPHHRRAEMEQAHPLVDQLFRFGSEHPRRQRWLCGTAVVFDTSDYSSNPEHPQCSIGFANCADVEVFDLALGKQLWKKISVPVGSLPVWSVLGGVVLAGGGVGEGAQALALFVVSGEVLFNVTVAKDVHPQKCCSGGSACLGLTQKACNKHGCFWGSGDCDSVDLYIGATALVAGPSGAIELALVATVSGSDAVPAAVFAINVADGTWHGMRRTSRSQRCSQPPGCSSFPSTRGLCPDMTAISQWSAGMM